METKVIKKILFINPLSEDFNGLFNISKSDAYSIQDEQKIKKFAFYMPLSIVALSSVVKKTDRNVNIKALDFNALIYKKLRVGDLNQESNFKEYVRSVLKNLKDEGYIPDLVSITFNITNEYNNFLDIVSASKQIFKEAVIVSGGVTITHIYKKILDECLDLDAVCLGEGEIPFERLVKNEISIENEFATCSAWATRGKTVSEIRAMAAENLDELPPYDFSILEDIDIYFETTYSNHPFKDKEIHEVYLSTSRGCPFNCYFCNTRAIQGNGIRYHSDEWVLNTIDNLTVSLANTKINCICFTDEMFFAKKDRAEKFLGYCKDKGLYAYACNSFITATDDVVRLVKEFGPGYTALPLESGSERVLMDVIRKKINFSKVQETIKMHREAGLIVRVGVMIGLPGETKEDIQDEIEFYMNLETDWLSINFATPFPGSDLYNDCVKYGYLTCDNISEINLKHAVISTTEFTAEYIQDMAYYINLLINFKHNYNMKCGNYERAIKMFETVLLSAPEHAITFYYMSVCYSKLGDMRKSNIYLEKFHEIIKNDIFWYECADKLGIIEGQ